MVVDIDKLENKKILASRALQIEDYLSAKRLYQDILESDPNDITAIFFTTYCSILMKKKKDYRQDSITFYKNMKIVFEILKERNLSIEEKTEKCTLFIKYTKIFCDILLNQTSEEYDKENDKHIDDENYDSLGQWLDHSDDEKEIYKVMASVCAFSADLGIDVKDCRFEMLDMTTKSLNFFGKDSKEYICEVLRQLRSMLLDKMEERGDDVTKEREADKKHEEILYNETVEEKVKQKISDMIFGR